MVVGQQVPIVKQYKFLDQSGASPMWGLGKGEKKRKFPLSGNKNAKLSISARIWYFTGHNRAIGEFEMSKTIHDYRGL